MTVFFTADTHFGHGGVLGLYRRPFPSVPDMDAALVANWNAVAGADDEVWHLGDFAVRQPASRIADLLARLNGRKHLIAGNTDTEATCALSAWTSVRPYAEIAVGDRTLVLCHYPFRTWRGIGQGWLNLHGHSHGRLKPLTRQFDVGVDARAFRPVTLDDLRAPSSR